jgi:hypothetical protein
MIVCLEGSRSGGLVVDVHFMHGVVRECSCRHGGVCVSRWSVVVNIFGGGVVRVRCY